MHPEHDEPVIIELDDPTPRGAGVIGAVVTITLIGIILAPFLIKDYAPPTTDVDPPPRMSSSRQMCEPRFDVPELLQPVTHFALPGFMRLCDWFAPPAPPAFHLLPNEGVVIQPLLERHIPHPANPVEPALAAGFRMQRPDRPSITMTRAGSKSPRSRDHHSIPAAENRSVSTGTREKR